jgi:hypothetical protein
MVTVVAEHLLQSVLILDGHRKEEAGRPQKDAGLDRVTEVCISFFFLSLILRCLLLVVGCRMLDVGSI